MHNGTNYGLSNLRCAFGTSKSNQENISSANTIWQSVIFENISLSQYWIEMKLPYIYCLLKTEMIHKNCKYDNIGVNLTKMELVKNNWFTASTFLVPHGASEGK